MAGTLKRRKQTQPYHSDMRELLIEHNKVVTDLETLRAAVQTIAAQLDLDGGVTGTTFAANAAVTTAAAMTAAQIGNHAGTAYST